MAAHVGGRVLAARQCLSREPVAPLLRRQEHGDLSLGTLHQHPARLKTTM
jgi:hypothetical protein